MIAGYDNIPVFSWFVLGGKCRNCQAKISARYWIVELLTGLLFVASFWKYGVSLDTVKLCAFSFLVLGLISTDADLKLLPDALTLPGTALGIAFSLLVPTDGFGQWLLIRAYDIMDMRLAWRVVSLVDACVGATFAAFFIWAIGAVYGKLRGVEAMGFGDVKLMAMVGAFLGVKLALLTIMLGSLTGSFAGIAVMASVYARRKRRWISRGAAPEKAAERAGQSAANVMRFYQMPFGVFLGAGALFSAFFGLSLLRWYFGYF